MTATEGLSLDDISVLLVWTAIAIYALAFIAYTIDLSRRSAALVEAQDVAVRDKELVAAGSGESVAQLRAQESAAEASLYARGSARQRLLFARIGTTLTWLAFLFHVGADVARGIAAERVPWSNMYEFSLTGTMLIVAVFLTVLFRYDLRFLGSFVTGLVVLLLGSATLAFYVEITPLMDPLKSVWLVVHVFVASLGTAFFALAFALSVLQLLQARRERKVAAQVEPPAGTVVKTGPRFVRLLPGADAMEAMAYRFAIIGFVFWTFTLIAGSIWANDAWGRYWGFDTKEVWTFVIWVLYAGYIHARATRGWRGTRSAWLSIVGFAAVMFNFTIVNMFFKGLHVYSGLS
ncbi:cytochrome c-type biogenesis protein CcsB [Microbacterium halimionae]|uniref:Cytochrome c-type biogenesis protein CcsB n=1 Tax=Microbacterium halimionae TaxID=1526413 RepID=A0A7W3PKX9_9MICO|nr:c-type cytochrome biogenesis protein CcsB [Microbacterium halimionae]MBA8815322.1 cytochrome c-type biogenesis protein CcsB [Microbacterium halimionae]NII93887.1 cytochrome c-type biogenesis protein CcsB [Microbacterium halimionae]